MKKFMDNVKKIFTAEGLLGVGVASAGVGYVLVGIDVIPDTIPVVGYADDVIMAIILFFLGAMLARKAMGKKK